MNCVIKYSVKQLQSNLRLFHTSLAVANIAKAMRKVMNRTGTKTRKFKYYESWMPTPTQFSKGAFEGTQSVNSKRANVLNKLFMRYITDLMATGECSSYFVGHGIEVSRVKTAPDFTCVNIYWIARGTKEDDVVEELLKAHVGDLRHELAQLKVVGVIPQLQFVKDKQYAMIAEVDRLLAIADFGDDFVPVNLAARLTNQLELNTTLEPHIINKIQSLEEADDNSEIVYEEPIPPMPQNIFNLNQSEIMERISKSKRKSQVSHRLDDESNIVTQSVNESAITFANEQEEREAFRNFLHKRQILKAESTKPDKNYEPGLEYFMEEWFERQKLEDNDSALAPEETDYLDEEFDQK